MTKEFTVNINGMDVCIQNRRKIRICLGIPVGDCINPIFFKTILLRMEEWSQKFDIVPAIETAIPLDEARNKIVKTAIEFECDYIFFIDSDTLIQREQLERLIDHDKDAITGISYMKTSPYYSLIRKRIGYRIYSPIEPSSDKELIKIDGAGFGCFLVKMSALNNIEYPWFRWHFYKYENKWLHIGEDLFFCEQLGNANINIYCDPTVQCVHIGTDVTIDVANKYKDLRLSILENIKWCKGELS